MAHAILGNFDLSLGDRVDAAYAVLDQALQQPAPPALGTPLAAEAATGWRPIETAPKGPDILLCFGGVVVTLGGWVSSEDQGAGPGDMSEGWWSVTCTEGAPTHWMPLPAPPTAAPPQEKE